MTNVVRRTLCSLCNWPGGTDTNTVPAETFPLSRTPSLLTSQFSILPTYTAVTTALNTIKITPTLQIELFVKNASLWQNHKLL